ncbi:non-ribosomal peptide synthetase [Microseira wollei]|uniref:Amino acid adenylation domain-containing protein n=1 Tax=Microseira wollei NIES-4236 TaxID=2530354 RepID=A0AAV3X8K7_9CYAN|nr:non-ribosomal peptide synthetase [Microseira wollei]GET38524.1 amino acid adenylation domain-containing protein [Microseira wollei NIES-4236]
MQRTLQSYQCIHKIFETQVLQQNHATALIYKDQQLSYSELNRRANQLAHYLQKLGVKPDVPVGICMERSLEMVVGLLGILKAGGAYLPLDPIYPPERLAFMLEDVQAPIILTQQQWEHKFPAHLTSKLVDIDLDWEIISQESQENPSSEVSPEHLAYIIYTSGSTGKPKGTEIPHRSMIGFMFGVNYLRLDSKQTLLQYSSISWDALTLELWPALLHGGRCVLYPGTIPTPDDLIQIIQQHGVSILWLTSALFNTIIDYNPEGLSGVKQLLIGGEAISLAHVRRALDILPSTEIINGYGPSECTVFSCCYPIPRTLGENVRSIPIGRPIGDRKVYLLDSYLNRVPIGVTGEICITGPSLARGYVNRPQLTAEKFIHNPFIPGERLYKTGDLGRFLPDGNIEFLGRIDHQVKIRGFRIEVGEIETLLSQHPQVQQVVVIVREDNPGNKYLTAYIVNETLTLTSSELRQFLKEHLPEYMIPAAFVMLKTLPLTPNGKVDRRVLPKPEIANSQLEAAFVAPRTWQEEKLAEIWCTVLHQKKLGIYDNFFELGGHSLLVTSVISRIRESFAIELPLRSLFTAPTIAELSQVITAHQLELQEQSTSGMTFDTLPPLVPQVRDTYIPLSFAQEDIWYEQQLAPESCAYNSFFVLRFSGSLSASALESSFNEIIRRHEILRTSFTVVEGQPVQIISPSLTIPLEIIDLQNFPQTERISEAEKLAALQYQHHFDLASVPLIKTTLLRLAQQEHWLIINMHHIITDGWSFDLLLEELRILYEAFVNDLPSPLPELPVQYADFTLWQRKYFNEKVIEQQLAYWLEKLTNTSQISNVVSNTQPQVSNSTSASVYSVVLPASLVVSIEALSRSQRVTIFIIILTALKILLFNYSGKNDILAIATVGNRSSVETEKMLGCFINDVILRSHLSSEQTKLSLLEQVKETLTEAINNKEIACQTVMDAITSKQPLNISACVTMVPPQNLPDWMLDVEFVTIKRERSLWDQEIPLELYISSPSVNNPTIEIKVLYSTDLFTDETIEFLFSYYQEILEKLVQHPTSQISEFEKVLRT